MLHGGRHDPATRHLAIETRVPVGQTDVAVREDEQRVAAATAAVEDGHVDLRRDDGGVGDGSDQDFDDQRRDVDAGGAAEAVGDEVAGLREPEVLRAGGGCAFGDGVVQGEEDGLQLGK